MGVLGCATALNFMDMSWTHDELAASTQFPGQILFPSGHHESDPHAQSAQVQNSTHSLGGVDEGEFVTKAGNTW